MRLKTTLRKMTLSFLGIKMIKYFRLFLFIFVVRINIDAQTYQRVEFNFAQPIQINNNAQIPALNPIVNQWWQIK